MATYHDPFMAAHAETLAAAGDNRLRFDEESWDWSARTAVGLDVEIYRNLFLVCFHRFADGKRMAYELSERCVLDRAAIQSILTGGVTISFNGLNYDLVVLEEALAGASCTQLYELSMQIVRSDHHTRFVNMPRLNHVDLMGVCPAIRQSLKMIHGRLHGRFLVDLPYPPDAYLTYTQMNVTTLYCMNDLRALEDLYRSLRGPLEMRVALGQRWGLDLRSRTDAQVGEAVVRAGVERVAGRRLSAPEPAAATFGYAVPNWIRFGSPDLRELVARLGETRFRVDGYGNITPPDWLKSHTQRVGKMTYALGIGGLHSTETHRALLSDHEHQLIDVDVASQYPSLIVRLGLYPAAAGPAFLRVYAGVIAERLAAKAAGDRVRMDGGRVAVNGVYGKLGSPYSFLYAPHAMVATTLTGQLSILMLIERAEEAGVPVVSANTDGVVFWCPRQLENALESFVLTSWETDTTMVLERTRYAALWSSSVNTYMALKETGAVKRKGWVANPWTEGDVRAQLMKNPQMTICSDSVVAWAARGVPIDETVYSCADPRAFVTLIKVTGGAFWRGHSLGRAVRYYWSADGDAIRYGDGKKVAKTEGARPMQELTANVPPDLDRLRYCEEAVRLAHDLGMRP